MPNNLTDKEIKKALEICSKSTNGCSHSKFTCEDCYLNGQPMCSSVLLQDALDLINRQEQENNELQLKIESYNAEIKELKCKNSNLTSDLTSLQNDLTSLKAEVERLMRDVFTYKIMWAKAESRETKAKAEAYKEFANNLEKAFQKTESQMPNNEVIKQTVQVCRNAIRLALNELVGDDNAKDL